MGEKNLTKRQVTPFDLAGFLRDRYLSMDPRWLGVFRVYFGVLLTVDFIRRWANAREFYSNDGVLPNHFSLFAPMGSHPFSLFHAFSTYAEVSILFAIATLSAVLFTVGYKTRLTHFLSALLIISANARNVFVENGGTVVVGILAVWTLFLPLGSRLSVDSVLRTLRTHREKSAHDLNDSSLPLRDDRSIVSLAVLALLLQWSIIYFFNTVHKTGDGWRDGTAIWWFWHQDRIVTWFGVWGREHVPVSVVRAMSYGTLAIEALMPALLLWPFWHKVTRPLALLAALALHGGIAMSSRLGPFSYVMFGFFLMFLGPAHWDYLRKRFRAPERMRRIVYDADCGICFLTCRVLRRLDVLGRLEFIGNDERDKIPESISDETLGRTAVVIHPDGTTSTEGRVVYEAISALPFGTLFAFWVRLPGPAGVVDALYRRFAKNRMRVSAAVGLGACGVPLPPTAQGEGSVEEGESDEAEKLDAFRPEISPYRRELGQFFGVAREGAVAVVMVAAASQAAIENPWLTQRIQVQQPKWMATIVGYPRIYQGWKMFSPDPPFDDGRLVVDGRTVDGRKLDPLTGKEPDFDPFTPTGWGHNQFWCDYSNRIRYPRHAGYRSHLREYLKRHHEFTGRPSDRLVAFELWWIQDKSPPPGRKKGEPLPPEKILSHGRVQDSGAAEWLSVGEGS